MMERTSLRKDNHRVYVGQGRYNFGALVLRHDGAALAFQRANRFVGVNRHHHLSAQRLAPRR